LSQLGWLHKDEKVLNNSEIKELFKGVDKVSTPSKTSYEQALETVKQFEQRQKDLEWIEKELSKGLQQFEQIKFQVNKGRKEVVFAGVRGDGQLKLTKSKCTDSDVFEESIGKLIAVKRALGEDTKKVEELIESKKITGGIISNIKAYAVNSPHTVNLEDLEFRTTT